MKKGNEKLKAVQKGIRESTKHSEYETFIPKSARKKTKKVARPRKNSLPKTRNLNTWTEAKYFSTIRSALRKAFQYYKPMQEALNLASRVDYKGYLGQEYIDAYNGNETLLKLEFIGKIGALQLINEKIPQSVIKKSKKVAYKNNKTKL